MSASTRPPARLAAHLLLAALLAVPVPLRAQEPVPGTGSAPFPGFSLQLVAGSSLGGPEDELGEQLASPESSASGRVSFWLAGRVPIGTGRWQAGLGGGWTNLCDLEGTAAGPGRTAGGPYVTVESSILSAGPMLWFDAAPALQLGAGPMLHVVDVDTGVAAEPDVEPPEGANRRWRAGLLAEAAIRFPANRPFYVILLGQYRWIPDATVDVPAARGTVPVHVTLSHGLVAAGFGARF